MITNSTDTGAKKEWFKKAMGATFRNSIGRIVALGAFALTMNYAFSMQRPVGGVSGKIIFEDSRLPADNANISLDTVFSSTSVADDMEELQPSLRVASNEEGEFDLAQVPVGAYTVSAYMGHHKVDRAIINISEGVATPITLTMTKSEPEFALSQHQRIFGTQEKVEIPVNGYTLGRGENSHDEMKVRIFKTKISDVMRYQDSASALNKLSQYAYHGSSTESLAIPTELLHPAHGVSPIAMGEINHKVVTADKEGFFYERIPLGKRSPGLYFVEVTHGKITVPTWVQVTDMALVTKDDARKTLAWVVNMKSGEPIAGAEIRRFKGGRSLLSARTAADGLASIIRPKAISDDKVENIAVAIRGEDECTIRHPESERSETDGQYKVHVYSERPIYRPGQKVYLKGIARKSLAAGAKYSIPVASQVKVVVNDPGGERIFKKQCSTSTFGSFAFDLDLTTESRTGVYTVITSIGNTDSTADFVVASYRKPEFEVKLTPKKPRYLVGDTIEIEVSGEYYFGAPLSGATIDYSSYSRPDYGAWDTNYDESDDNGPRRHGRNSYDYMGSTDKIGKVKLDEHGKAVIRFTPQFKNRSESPQDRVITLNASVVDDSNRTAEVNSEIKVSAGEYHLTVQPEGYLAFPSNPTSVQVKAVHDDGSPVNGLAIHLTSNLEIWKEGESALKPLAKADAVTDISGIATFPITPKESGSIQLEATSKDTGNRQLRANSYLWCAGDTERDISTEGGDLTLLSDKRSYNPGDTARLLINSHYTGQTVLLTVEGDRLFRVITLPLTAKSTIYNLPILKEYGPNVFLAATYIKNKKYVNSQVGLRVANAERSIKVNILPDKKASTGEKLAVFHPRDKIGYSVLTTDSQGKPVAAEFSLAVVDESIYALREDNPSALPKTFYPKRVNEVRTSYSFEQEFLGDADKAEPKIAARKKFPDTAYWNPSLTTDVNGKAHVVVELPDNLTTWRATAIAQTHDTAFGNSQCKVMTNLDFSVRLEAPRYLTWRDQSLIQATVHNNTSNAVDAFVKLATTGVSVDGDGTRKVQVPAKGSVHVEWKIQTEETPDATFDVTAWTPKSVGTQLSDRMQLTIPMRPHGRDEIARVSGEISSGSQSEVFRLDPLSDLKNAALTIRIDPSVATSLSGGLKYLVGFPYGCTEQTMSRFLPDILAKKIQSNVRGLEGLPTGAKWNEMLQKGIIRLSKFQHRSGAWGWWETDSDDPWMTSYVLMGLIEARNSGVKINTQTLDKGITAGIAMLSKADEFQMPFLLYALACTGDKTATQKVNIIRTTMNTATLEGNSIAFLLLTDNLLNRDKSAMLSRLRELAVAENGMRHWKGKNKWGWEDERLSTAVVLRAELAAGAPEQEITETLRWLMVHRTGDYWGDTRSTCWVILSLCDYLRIHPDSANPMGQIMVKMNGSPVSTLQLAESDPMHPEIIFRVPVGQIKSGKNDVQLTRSGGSGVAFYSMEMRQLINREDLGGFNHSALKIRREYYRLTPKRTGPDHVSLEPELVRGDMKPGENIRVRLTISAARDMEYVLVEDPMPAGCEPNERGAPEELGDWSYWWSSVDIRDNRIAFFARSIPKGDSVIEYNLRAMTSGSYHVMPTFVQPMYDPATTAYSPEARVNIH